MPTLVVGMLAVSLRSLGKHGTRLTVERLVKSAHAIEQSSGNLLARQSVLRPGRLICQIIVDRLGGIPNYEQMADCLITDIVATIQTAAPHATTLPRSLSEPESAGDSPTP